VTELLLPSAPSTPGPPGPRPMIVADNARVDYRVYASGKRFSPRDNLLGLKTFRGGRELQTIPALRGVSFTASEGETIGVIGHNGSGKSTLFRAMSGLIPTSEGTIWAADRPVLLGVNAALVPELSGENNIKLGLLAMGFTPEEAAAHVDGIADFAELNEYIHHPMRTYSSGMGARLRFAIASAKAHSILLIDEALSVGDRRFKLKSEQRIRELRDSAGLVMIVSHSAGSLRDTCERVLWIHKGELRDDGPARSVIDEYIKWTKNPGSGAVGAAAPKQQPVTARAEERNAEVESESASAQAVEGPLSAFEQLLADAAVEAKEIVVPSEGVRTIARRERYRRSVRERNRRRAIAIAVTGAAVLLAVGAGAAIALVSGLPKAAGVSTPAGAVVPGAVSTLPVETGAAVPVVAGFAADTASVVCESTGGEASVRLSWHVGNAADVAVASAANAVDAFDAPLGSGLPVSAQDYQVPFPCEQSSWSYTLTAKGSDGSRVSSVVTVTRAPLEQANVESGGGETDPDGQPTQPPSDGPGEGTVPVPAPSPSDPGAPPSEEPEPTPTESETPAPEQSETPMPVETPSTESGTPPGGEVATP